MSCSRGCWALGMAFGAPARTVLQTLGGPDVFTCVGACATDPGRMPEGEPGSGTAKGGAARAVLLSWHRGQPLGGLIRATWRSFYLQNKAKPSSLSLLGERLGWA